MRIKRNPKSLFTYQMISERVHLPEEEEEKKREQERQTAASKERLIDICSFDSILMICFCLFSFNNDDRLFQDVFDYSKQQEERTRRNERSTGLGLQAFSN